MQLMKIDESDLVRDRPVHLGQRVSAARQKHSLTQADVAERLSVSSKAVSVWEGGGSIGPNNVKPLRALLDELERSVPGPEADPAFAVVTEMAPPPTEASAEVTEATPSFAEGSAPAEPGRKPGPKRGRMATRRGNGIASAAAQDESPTAPEKPFRERYLEALLDKLPPFDGSWPPGAQDCWLQAFGILVDSLEAL
jgi:transcriptional regulator with XRE-family HTH domain